MPTLDDLRGTRAGRTALVMGSGPSLGRLQDRKRLVKRFLRDVRFIPERKPHDVTLMLPNLSQPERARKLVTIAVNDAILRVPDADFYFTTDIGMLEYNHWRLVLHTRCQVVGNAPAFNRPAMRAIFGMKDDRLILYEQRKKGEDLRMTVRDNRLIRGISSLHVAVNFAVLLGCNPIFLLGADCQTVSGLKYFWEFANQPGPGGTVSGHASHYLHARADAKLLPEPTVYGEGFDARTNEPCGGAVVAWKSMQDANPDMDLWDASMGALRGALRQTNVESVLERPR